jgi:predicted small lipoprotein YifL
MDSQDRTATSRRRLAKALLAIAAAAALTACGKKGAPEPPDDADPRYPRQYPSK